MEPTAAIVVIGNEILTAKVEDANGPFLVRELRALGVAVRALHVVPDEVEVIARTVAECARSSTWVFTSGGVGPTLDDVTFEGIAAAFGTDLVGHPELERIIRAHLPDPVPESYLRMARVPRDTELVRAEGLPWPAARVRNVYVFPGSPELVEKKWTFLRETFRSTPFHVRRVFTTLEEGLVAPHLDRVQASFPEVDLGSYPLWKPTDHAVQVTVEGKDPSQVEAACDDLLRGLDPGTVVRVE